MVFIHGESYEWNSGNAYDGMDKNKMKLQTIFFIIMTSFWLLINILMIFSLVISNLGCVNQFIFVIFSSVPSYSGSVLSSYGQVIVVTLNYRLGILGKILHHVIVFNFSPKKAWNDTTDGYEKPNSQLSNVAQCHVHFREEERNKTYLGVCIIT